MMVWGRLGGQKRTQMNLLVAAFHFVRGFFHDPSRSAPTVPNLRALLPLGHVAVETKYTPTYVNNDPHE
eukprot:scaffold1736_cov127-Cylindrotheca_fusiformis.AAC.48